MAELIPKKLSEATSKTFADIKDDADVVLVGVNPDTENIIIPFKQFFLDLVAALKSDFATVGAGAKQTVVGEKQFNNIAINSATKVNATSAEINQLVGVDFNIKAKVVAIESAIASLIADEALLKIPRIHCETDKTDALGVVVFKVSGLKIAPVDAVITAYMVDNTKIFGVTQDSIEVTVDGDFLDTVVVDTGVTEVRDIYLSVSYIPTIE